VVQLLNRVRMPNLTGAPGSPALGELYYDTTNAALYYWNGTAWITGVNAEQWWSGVGAPAGATGSVGDWYLDTGGYAGNPPWLSALPGSAIDGQEIMYLADSTNGVGWHLKYRAAEAGSFKWYYIGGPPLVAVQAALDSITSTTYAAPPTNAGPSITVPLAGDYDVRVRFRGDANAANGNCFYSYAVGATAAIDGDAAALAVSASTVDSITSVKRTRKTGLAAATALAARYKVGGGTGRAYEREMQVWPVRVG